MCYTYDYFRPLAWHDLAFYNADLYKDLRQMMLDAAQGKKDDDEFIATYCSYFEVRERCCIKIGISLLGSLEREMSPVC